MPPSSWKPISTLAQAVYAAGFLYDPGQDILYSRMDALQRQFGYAYGYDVAALGVSMIIDCEPIFFDYAGKHWMIELWKGHYVLEAGCEIGVYNRPIGSVYPLLDATVGPRPHDKAHSLFFDCANDNELLEMSFTLYKNGQKLFSRGPEKHWWLTGFKWGVYARPDELTMDVSITCRDEMMRAALVKALEAMGYKNKVTVSSNSVSFKFAQPTTHQPRSDTREDVQAAEVNNQRIVNKYQAFGLRNNDPNTIPSHVANELIGVIGIYSADFFVQVVANLAKRIGLDAYKVINEIAQAFKVGLDVATDVVIQAGYEFSSWVGSVEKALGINLNFSCIVEISNRGNPYDLILENHEIRTGIYKVSLPKRISAGRVGRFLLEDPKPTPVGAEAWVRYYYVDSDNKRHSVRFKYACPTPFWDPNVAETDAPFNFYTKSENANSGWSGLNQVKKDGHPLFVAFVYGNTPPPG